MLALLVMVLELVVVQRLPRPLLVCVVCMRCVLVLLWWALYVCIVFSCEIVLGILLLLRNCFGVVSPAKLFWGFSCEIVLGLLLRNCFGVSPAKLFEVERDCLKTVQVASLMRGCYTVCNSVYRVLLGAWPGNEMWFNQIEIKKNWFQPRFPVSAQ